VPLVPIFWFLLNATTIVASATAVFWLVRCIELAHGRPRRERWAIQHRYERRMLACGLVLGLSWLLGAAMHTFGGALT
jgi:hypothetical protein